MNIKIRSSKIAGSSRVRADAEGKPYTPSWRYEDGKRFAVLNFSSADRDYEVWVPATDALIFSEMVFGDFLKEQIKIAKAQP